MNSNMNANIDGEAVLHQIIMQELEREGNEETVEVVKVFERHGISVVEALTIFLELAPIIAKYHGGAE